MDRKRILDYAKLCQECYEIPYDTDDDIRDTLPDDWELAYAPTGHRKWGTFFAVFVNHRVKEVVFGIRGTEVSCAGNLLTDAVLLLYAITGREGDTVPGEDSLARYAFGVQGATQRKKKSGVDTKKKNGAPCEQHFILSFLKTCFLQPLLLVEFLFLFTLLLVIKICTKVKHPFASDKKPVDVPETDPGSSPEVPDTTLDFIKGKVTTFTKDKYDGYQMVFVGHSLGGVYAALCAARLGKPCFTFDSPGTGKMLEQRGLLKESLNIFSFLSAPNPINMLSKQVINIYRVKIPLCAKSRLSRVWHAIVCGSATCWFLPLPIINDVLFYVSDQHDYDKWVQYLSHEDSKIVKMKSWPELSVGLVFSYFVDYLRPFQVDKPGIRTWFDEERMRKAAIRKLKAYREDEQVRYEPDQSQSAETAAAERARIYSNPTAAELKAIEALMD